MFILPPKLAEEMGTDKRRTKNSPYPFNQTIPQRAPKKQPIFTAKAIGIAAQNSTHYREKA